VRYLLDSVIVIDHLNAIEPATLFLAEHGAASTVSVITRAEVLAGFDDTNAALALELLNLFSALPITTDVADLAARIRHAERLKLPDAFQAALAQHHNLTLVTRNTRDFRGVAGLDLVVPYTL
jgi:predicted nucleic acid-binding protein